MRSSRRLPAAPGEPWEGQSHPQGSAGSSWVSPPGHGREGRVSGLQVSCLADAGGGGGRGSAGESTDSLTGGMPKSRGDGAMTCSQAKGGTGRWHLHSSKLVMGMSEVRLSPSPDSPPAPPPVGELKENLSPRGRRAGPPWPPSNSVHGKALSWVPGACSHDSYISRLNSDLHLRQPSLLSVLPEGPGLAEGKGQAPPSPTQQDLLPAGAVAPRTRPGTPAQQPVSGTQLGVDSAVLAPRQNTKFCPGGGGRGGPGKGCAQEGGEVRGPGQRCWCPPENLCMLRGSEQNRHRPRLGDTDHRVGSELGWPGERGGEGNTPSVHLQGPVAQSAEGRTLCPCSPKSLNRSLFTNWFPIETSLPVILAKGLPGTQVSFPRGCSLCYWVGAKKFGVSRALALPTSSTRTLSCSGAPGEDLGLPRFWV